MAKIGIQDLTSADVKPLWAAFGPILSRELPFAVTKFLAFDIVSTTIVTIANSQLGESQIQPGVGATGLAISAISGAVAGIAGAVVSHPADLILTLTSSSKSSNQYEVDENDSGSEDKNDWRPLLKGLLAKDGGIANLFAGLPARGVFFFLVIGLQFFLYDFVKNLFSVGSDDLSLVLDVFYAVRQGLN